MRLTDEEEAALWLGHDLFEHWVKEGEEVCLFGDRNVDSYGEDEGDVFVEGDGCFSGNGHHRYLCIDGVT